MNPVVFIASHIRYDSQLGRLTRCLESLLAQEHVPAICISISLETSLYKQEFNNNVKQNYPTVNFHAQKKRFFQMEHMRFLFERYASQYDLILFCDDDDTYVPQRVKFFCQCAAQHPSVVCFLESIHGEDYKEYNEFWKYAVRPSFLKVFFERVEKAPYLLQNLYSDMLFRCFLRHAPYAAGVVQTPTRLYQHDNNNPYSVCEVQFTTSNVDKSMYDSALMCAFHGSDNYEDAWRSSGGSMSLFRKLVPNYRQILQDVDRVLAKDTISVAAFQAQSSS
jgi:hypothetical protein